MNEDDIDEFWNDYEDDNESKLRLLIDFELSDIELPSIEFKMPEPKFKQKLRASIFIPPKPGKKGLF